MKEFPGKIEKFYNLEPSGDLELVLETLGRKWGFLLGGGVVNTDRTSRRILKDWQEGKIR